MSKKQLSITGVEDIINHSLRDRDLLWAALQAAGSGVGQPDGNKSLAMLGEMILKLALLDGLAAHGIARGDIDSTILEIVSNNNLAAVCNEAGITSYINRNPSQQRVQSRTRADTIQAIIGAVYLDSGKNIDVVKDVIEELGLMDFNAIG